MRKSKSISRRTALKAASTGAICVAAGYGGWRLWSYADTHGAFNIAMGSAFSPWKDWAQYQNDKAPLTLVRAGILAASPLNSQPWLFMINETGDIVDLYADLSRHTGALDPYGRELFFGLGCCLENMYQTARSVGYRTVIEMLPGTLERLDQQDQKAAPPQHVARLHLTSRSPIKSVFHAAIPYRRTHRGPYIRKKPVPDKIMLWMQRMADAINSCQLFLFLSPENQETFKDLVIKSTKNISNDQNLSSARQKWLHTTSQEIDQKADGLTIDGEALSPIKATLAKLAPKSEPADINAHWLKQTQDVHLATAPVFGMVAVQNLYDKRQTLQAGMLWQRLHLYATANGLAMQPLCQPFRMVDHERAHGLKPQTTGQILELVSDPTYTPCFGFRMGYSLRAVPPSPRKGIGRVLLQDDDKDTTLVKDSTVRPPSQSSPGKVP